MRSGLFAYRERCTHYVIGTDQLSIDDVPRMAVYNRLFAPPPSTSVRAHAHLVRRHCSQLRTPFNYRPCADVYQSVQKHIAAQAMRARARRRAFFLL